MTSWINGKVHEINLWQNYLFTLRIQADVERFIAGQFTKIAININGKRIHRAYSYVNAPSQKILEFYLVYLPNGKVTPFLFNLAPKDNILISKEASGFFIINSIPQCSTLWMLATGTAIGPYLSILQYGKNLERFDNIVLVHAVRYFVDLNYLSLMEKLQQEYKGKLHIKTIISREQKKGSLHGRIPGLIKNKELEKSVGLSLEPNSSHVMICGNPKMIFDTQNILKESRGMYKNFKNKPGHITTENYW